MIALKTAWLEKLGKAYFKALEPVGIVINFALMFAAYFTVVAAVALLAKAVGKKFMQENHKGNSYWVEREKLPEDLEKYLRRQF